MSLVLFVALNAVSIEYFPAVWLDEVMFTDPAANLAIDGKFVSTAWPDQPDNQIWAGNAPLYSLLLAAWIKLFGLSIVSVRSFNLVLVSCSIACFWRAARSAGLLRSSRYGIAAILVVLLEYGVALNYRAGRYDGLGLFLIAIAAYGATRVGLLRLFFVFAACIAKPATGLQVALYMSIVLFLALLAFGRGALPAVIAGAGGLAVGAILLFSALAGLGVVDVFLSTIDRLRRIDSTPKDPSFWLLLLATVLQMARSGAQTWWRQPVLGFLASVGLLAPLLVYVAGRFPTYYTWMSVVPLSAVLFTLIERGKMLENRIVTGVVAGLVVTACLMGLPLQLASGAFYRRERSYEEVRRVVGPIEPNDVVIADPAAYYAVRPKAAKVYLTEAVFEGQWMTDEQLRRVNLMVIRPQDFDILAERLGGGWQQGTKSPPARGELPLFGHRFGDKLVATYDLQAFRRVKGADR